MSAYLCNPEHIGELAKWYCRYEKKNTGRTFDPGEVATTLAEQNIRSIEERYPDTQEGGAAKSFFVDERNNETFIAECVAAAGSGRDAGLKAADIFKMAACYNYQACETDDYEGTEARKLAVEIMLASGYEMAEALKPKVTWEYSAA